MEAEHSDLEDVNLEISASGRNFNPGQARANAGMMFYYTRVCDNNWDKAEYIYMVTFLEDTLPKKGSSCWAAVGSRGQEALLHGCLTFQRKEPSTLEIATYRNSVSTNTQNPPRPRLLPPRCTS